MGMRRGRTEDRLQAQPGRARLRRELRSKNVTDKKFSFKIVCFFYHALHFCLTAVFRLVKMKAVLSVIYQAEFGWAVPVRRTLLVWVLAVEVLLNVVDSTWVTIISSFYINKF